MMHEHIEKTIPDEVGRTGVVNTVVAQGSPRRVAGVPAVNDDQAAQNVGVKDEQAALVMMHEMLVVQDEQVALVMMHERLEK